MSDSPAADAVDEKLIRKLAASVIRRAPMDAANLLVKQDDEVIAGVISLLEPAMAQKILRRLPRERSGQLSRDLTESISEQWEMNRRYPEDSIGRLMGPAYGRITSDVTVQQTIDFIRQQADNNIVFPYAYVVDEQDRLQGVVVMRDLLFAGRDDNITSVMIEQPFRFSAAKSVKDAMLDVVHRHYPVYPVCDDDGVLLGVVQGYELFEEHTIEVSAQSGRMVGVDNEEHLSTPIMQCLKYRHPWLQLNLATAFLAAFVVGFFEDTIQQVVVLAAFLPVLAGQSGNTGCQALAVTLRGMTLGELKSGLEHTLFSKELRLGMMNGALVGVTAGLGMLAYAMISGSDSAMLLALVLSCGLATGRHMRYKAPRAFFVPSES